jgi:protein-L-isoaspartate(D-aspartate) O-methyltransferase
MRREETLSSLVERGYIWDQNVLEAMRTVPREEFVPKELKAYAWDDHPLPVGFGQTISAPHMYAFMLEHAEIKEGHNVLEIGAGSGYGAALLSFLVGKKGRVYSVELVPQLASIAKGNLSKAGFKAQIIEGDGYHGLAVHAPYDRILVTAACQEVPPPLLSQLRLGGRMLLPVGSCFQELVLVEKTHSGIKQSPMLPVVFVPLVRKQQP